MRRGASRYQYISLRNTLDSDSYSLPGRNMMSDEFFFPFGDEKYEEILKSPSKEDAFTWSVIRHGCKKKIDELSASHIHLVAV